MTVATAGRPRRAPLWKRFAAWWSAPGAPFEMTMFVIVVVVACTIALGTQQAALALLAIGVILVGLAIRLYWDHVFDAVTYRRRFSAARAFVGDTVDVELTATNAKPLIIGRLVAAEVVSGRIELPEAPTRRMKGARTRAMDAIYTLGMYERSTQRYRIPCDRRGWYRFGPATLTAQDAFGFTTRDKAIEGSEGFLVLPRIVPVAAGVLPARLPLGDYKPVSPLVDDPVRIAGVRPYVAGDSPRRIHWRATARTGELQTRVFEPSADIATMLFVDTDSVSSPDDDLDELQELRLTVAASLAREVYERGQQVGLALSARLVAHRRRTVIRPGRLPGQLGQVLTALAEVDLGVTEPVSSLLAAEHAALPWGATVVVITSNLDVAAQRVLLRLTRAGGRRCTAIVVGDRPQLLTETRRRVNVLHLDGEEAWDAVTRIDPRRIA